MKVGLKIYWEKNFYEIESLLKYVDFLEIKSLIGQKFNYLDNLGIPITIHNGDLNQNVNFANPKRFKENKESLDFSIKLANKYNAKFIVVHPEAIENKDCSIEQTIKFLQKYADKRIIVETCQIGEKTPIRVGKIEDMKKILKESNKRLCLDISHSSQAAVFLKEDIIGFMKKMMKLKPVYYHFHDTLLHPNQDAHLHLGEGELPLKQILKLIPKNSWITLETPKEDLGKVKKDIEFIRKFGN